VNNLLKLKAEITGGYRIESPCERTGVRLFGIVRSALLIQSGSASDTSKKKKRSDQSNKMCNN